MEKITQEQADEIIKKCKEDFKEIIEEGGKITDITIYEKDKVTKIRKIEPVNGEATSSEIVETKDFVSIMEDYSFTE